MIMTDLNNDERIAALDKVFWIGYTRAINIRQELETLLQHPRMHRMPNMALIGETNNGKTMLLNNFYRKYKVEPTPTNSKSTLPVLMIQMPPKPDENRLYDALLSRLFADESPREPITSKLNRLKILLDRIETKIIVIDEFQHNLAASLKNQRVLLNAIKYMNNEFRISFVASGTMETLNALQADPQISNRFDPKFLPKWNNDDDFKRLLASIEIRLGLKNESNLAEDKMSNLVLSISEGTIGEIHSLLKKLAKFAITSGTEQITPKMLDAKILDQIGWRSPSSRNRATR